MSSSRIATGMDVRHGELWQ